MSASPAPRRLVAALALLALAALGTHCPRPEPDALGPYAVGRTTFEIFDAERARALTVDVWYPAVDDGTAPPSAYDLLVTQLVSEVALADAPVADGTFPLVVFSHGNNGVRYQSFFLTEHLASHGFVVAAPDHAGNTATDLFLPVVPPFETRDRPLDVSFVIDAMLERGLDPADPFFGAVDPFRIGVAGHSFGGFTTLAMVSGFQDVPRDERVSVIMPISPATAILDDAELAAIDVPTFVLGGTLDDVTPVDPNSLRAFEESSGLPRWRVDVHDAGHNSFTDICAIGEALFDVGLPPELVELILGNLEDGCAPELIPIEEAQRITKLYATSFFETKLARELGFARHLTRFHALREDLPVDFFRRFFDF